MSSSKVMKAVALASAVSLMAVCGGDESVSVTDPTDLISALAGASSLNPTCSALTGIDAVYFDFESGYLVNLPFTPLLASTGGVVSGGDNSLWSFPPGYAAQTITAGVIIQRSDNAVFFKHSAGEQLFVDPGAAFNEQVGRALQTFGFGSGDATFVCGRDVIDTSGPLPQRLISGYYVTASHTFIIAIRTIDAGVLVSLATRVAAGPSNEYSSLAGNVFLPMVWAQFPGGSGLLPECNDGADNDGDLLVDFPLDPECKDPFDNDESRR